MKQFFIESNIVPSFVKGNISKVKDKYFFPPKIFRDVGSEEDKIILKLSKNFE